MERIERIENYLIDSDVLIDYLRGVQESKNFLLKIKEEKILWVSTINIMEIYSGKEIKDTKKRKIIDEFLDEFQKIEVTESIAKRAGRIRLDFKIAFADSAIAATCLEHNLVLVTRNKKHFSQIKNLKLKIPNYKIY